MTEIVKVLIQNDRPITPPAWRKVYRFFYALLWPLRLLKWKLFAEKMTLNRQQQLAGIKRSDIAILNSPFDSGKNNGIEHFPEQVRLGSDRTLPWVKEDVQNLL